MGIWLLSVPGGGKFEYKFSSMFSTANLFYLLKQRCCKVKNSLPSLLQKVILKKSWNSKEPIFKSSNVQGRGGVCLCFELIDASCYAVMLSNYCRFTRHWDGSTERCWGWWRWNRSWSKQTGCQKTWGWSWKWWWEFCRTTWEWHLQESSTEKSALKKKGGEFHHPQNLWSITIVTCISAMCYSEPGLRGRGSLQQRLTHLRHLFF